MLDIRWRFREMMPAEINLGTVVGEFFGDEPINTRLVREAIQNSLDAGVDKVLGDPAGSGGPVRVRFSLAGIGNPLPAARAARYFAGLADHLDANGISLDDAAPDGSLPYLVVEDAGAMGLCGDWSVYDTDDKGNYFYWFFRNIGLSGKGESDNGSWGLGKWVFPDASRVKSYLAVTSRHYDPADPDRYDGDTLLMGQTALNKHSIDGRRYDAFGYYAALGSDGVPLPLRKSDPEHAPFIDQCVADFGLHLRDRPGLSVVIPLPRDGFARVPGDDEGDDDHLGVNAAELLGAVVHNYFYPIIAGSLEVEVDGDGAPVVVSEATIDAVVAGMDLPEAGEGSLQSYRRLFEMCRASLDSGVDHEVLPALPSANRSGYDAGLLDGWRNRYRDGELLAFRIGADVDARAGGLRQTGLRLYLQRDASLSEGHDYYVRGTLSIHGGMDFIRRHREACALLVVDEKEPLAAMLRDSEPPAHTVWNPNASRAFANWRAASRRIRAVRNAPGNLLTLLEAPVEELQKDAFADIFFWEGGSSPGPGAGGMPGGGGISYPPRKPVVPRPPPEFEIVQSAGGFRVRLTAAGVAGALACVHLRVAYAGSSGNPFRRYRPEDFRLHGRGDTLALQMGGCRPRWGKDGNEVFLEIDDPDEFEFAVSGFDPRRDVRVSVERVREGSGVEADQ